MEPARLDRQLSTEQLRRATTKVALAQAQIGIAVLGILGTPEVLTSENRESLRVKVEESVNDLIKLANQLMDVIDGN